MGRLNVAGMLVTGRGWLAGSGLGEQLRNF